ncbi:hypothetical protein Hanom_Chr04g00373701 [Helianthus anomalus]
MDGVNKPDENGKISNLLDPDAEKQTFGQKSRTCQTSGTKMTFYSIQNHDNNLQIPLL